MLGTDVTPEMVRSKEMKPITSKQIYAQEAKKDLVKTHVGAGKSFKQYLELLKTCTQNCKILFKNIRREPKEYFGRQ